MIMLVVILITLATPEQVQPVYDVVLQIGQ